jgi:DNA-directed RNA polymerase specialized sigma24 family protein
MRKDSCATDATGATTLHASLAEPLGLRTGAGLGPRDLVLLLRRGDPLGLFERGRRRLSERGVFLSPRRLRLRVQARVALEAPGYRGAPVLARWLDRCIDRSIEELVEEQHADEVLELRPGGDRAYQCWLASCLDVETDRARLACVALNALPEACRRTFFALEVEGRTPERLVAERGGTPGRIREQAHRARRAVLDALRRREHRVARG